jgi:hypothetical protein
MRVGAWACYFVVVEEVAVLIQAKVWTAAAAVAPTATNMSITTGVNFILSPCYWIVERD